MKSKYQVVIVGSGIGGLSAARALSGHGLDILVVDENPHCGGQLLRKSSSITSFVSKLDPDRMKTKGFDLIEKVKEDQNIDWVFQAQILGAFKNNRLLIGHGGRDRTEVMSETQGEIIIFATGARERYLPFKGWTLPGVMSLGAAQILMKSHGVLPARSTLIAGTSPLMMVLASQLAFNKGRVKALVDENTWMKKAAFVQLLGHHWPKLIEGALHSATLICNRAPQYSGFRIVQARGKNGFESAVIAKTSSQGSIIPGTQRTVFAKALCVGYGFVPNIELPVQAGCKIEFKNELGGWIVKIDEQCETSIKDVFAIGELTGIAGAKKSYIQGEMAALTSLQKLGKTRTGNHRFEHEDKMQRLGRQNREQETYAAFLNRLCHVPDSAYLAIPDDTVICRCEQITMGMIKKRIQQGFDTMGGIKKATRAGMGRCQGRVCSSIIFSIVSALTLKKPEPIGTSVSRTPVKNISIKAFLDRPLT